MARSKKLFAHMTGALLSMSLVLNMGITAEAKSNTSYLNPTSGGIAAVLDPTDKSGSELLQYTLDSVGSEVVVEEEETQPLVMANVKSVLNIREEAKNNSKKVGVIYKDCAGVVLERKDGWTKLQSGNLIGWARDEYLLFGEDAEKLADLVGVMVATNEADALCVRIEPDSEAEYYGVLVKGEMVEVVPNEECPEEWICINYEGMEGYVAAEYVTIERKLDHGETLEEIQAKHNQVVYDQNHVTFGEYLTDEETLYLLAALIQCEAGGEPYEGQVAVGAVVMNRVRSTAYPNTIPGVIYASGQFTPAMSGKVDRVYASGQVRQSCIDAAKEALSGYSNVGDLTHFRVNDGRDGIVIGNHVFH